MSLHFHFDEITVNHANGAPISKTSTCCDTCGNSAMVWVIQLNTEGHAIARGLCLHHAIAEGLLGTNAEELLGHTPNTRRDVRSCRCGMTDRLLRATGRAGCSKCYTTFAQTLSPTIGSLRVSDGYAGKMPSREANAMALSRQVAGLKASMAMAILDENYEQAAHYRDQLAALNATH